eukprot:1423311-Pleurochrysis_carterae.AAC.1
MVARSSLRLPPGQLRRPLLALTWKPSAFTASPTSTFAGAACSPNSASASTANWAWTCTLLVRGAARLRPPVCGPGRSRLRPPPAAASPRTAARAALRRRVGPPRCARGPTLVPPPVAAAPRRTAPGAAAPTPPPALIGARTCSARTRRRTPCVGRPPRRRAPP